jgi:transposase-like protein
MAILMANEAADRVPVVVTRTGRRRQFSEEDKRRIVEETCRPGQSLSAVARRYGIDLRLTRGSDAAADRRAHGPVAADRPGNRFPPERLTPVEEGPPAWIEFMIGRRCCPTKKSR